MVETLVSAILKQIEQPKKDIEHNVRALLQEAISQMDLVSKTELERQQHLLQQTTQRMNELSQQVQQLEEMLKAK